MSTCNIVPVASGLHGADAISSLVASVQPAFAHAGAELVTSIEKACPSEPIAVFVVTGGTEQQVLAAWAARQQFVPGEPLLLITHPGHNSLPAALEALARVQREGATGRIVMVDAGEPGPELGQAMHDLLVWHRLHKARVGLLGAPSDWLVASVPDRAEVAQRWGVTIVDADLPQALDRFEENIEAPVSKPVHVHARRHAGEPDAAEVETAGRFEPVLREVVSELRLDAVSVRCFDLLTAGHTSGCVALSALNDTGVIAGCEGDVVSTIGLLWANLFTGQMGWMANPAAADRRTGRIELAHCTVPLSMVRSYELDTHFESGIGVGIAGELPPGPVTLLRLGGRALELLWCVDGEAVPTTPREGRCRTQLDVVVDPEAVGELLDHPLGNHLVLVPGHHAQHLRRWFTDMLPAA
ncbi:MAG: hypothetical protein WCC60_19510 [Ilumatobacteraceae bacterium]